MKSFFYIFFLIYFLSCQTVFSQTGSLTVKTGVSKEVVSDFKTEGRLFLFVSSSRMSQPRLNTWPDKGNMIFATNLKNWKPGDVFTFNAGSDLINSVDVTLDKIPEGNYTVQVLWVQNQDEPGINGPGNLYSESVNIDLAGDMSFELPLKYMTGEEKLAEHPLLHEVKMKSEVLSEWHGKDVFVKAAVLLPSSFHKNLARKYPVRYNIAGFGGRYTRANKYVLWMKNFLEWWESDEAPQIVNVFLDGYGPFGDSYQMNSENSGPYGTSLIEELIPLIEKEFRGMGIPESRFLDGCSTGGWVSLALQLFYPGFFGGCFSYSPDPVDFEKFQLVNIYSDENAYINEYGYMRPLMRNLSGETVISQKDFIRFENVLGKNDTYLTSGGQFGSFTALFSPKGDDGLPVPLFDPYSGKINRDVAEHWRKYDLKHYVETNWKKLGPEIEGKIWIWMGDMDEFFLNPALRNFDEMLQETENPKSDAVIRFSPMEGHCSGYNDRKVLQQIEEKWELYLKQFQEEENRNGQD